VKKVAKTVKNHWNGILSWFDSKLSNGFIEAINGLIQSVKRRARGIPNHQKSDQHGLSDCRQA